MLCTFTKLNKNTWVLELRDLIRVAAKFLGLDSKVSGPRSKTSVEENPRSRFDVTVPYKFDFDKNGNCA